MKMPYGAEIIISRLNSNGYRGDIVGGCVRDFLLGKNPNDFDITTDALPEDMRRIFSDFRTVDTGIKHGTLTVVIDTEPYEVTTYRIDGEYTDNRHPDKVTFTQKLSDDLSRRDFTVNAMCYNEKDGLTDIFGGMDDLSSKIIRAVGDPVLRFHEDALRILRALRFASCLGFTIEDNTSRAIFETAHLLSNVSRERVYTEWKKLISGIAAAKILKEYGSVISIVIPELEGIGEMVLPPKFLDNEPCVRELSLFALVAKNAAKDSFLSAMNNLKADNRHKKFGTTVLENLSLNTETETDIRMLLVKLGVECALGVVKLKILLGEADQSLLKMTLETLDKNPCVRISDMNIDGNDLAGLGIKGRAIGEVLNTLLIMIAEGKVENKKAELLKVAKNIYNS